MQAHSNEVINDVRGCGYLKKNFCFGLDSGNWKLEQVYERELEVIEWFIKRALELLL